MLVQSLKNRISNNKLAYLDVNVDLGILACTEKYVTYCPIECTPEYNEQMHRCYTVIADLTASLAFYTVAKNEAKLLLLSCGG